MTEGKFKGNGFEFEIMGNFELMEFELAGSNCIAYSKNKHALQQEMQCEVTLVVTFRLKIITWAKDIHFNKT